MTSASVASLASTFPASRFSFPDLSIARSITMRMCSSFNGSNTNTRHRDNSGAVSSKLGFSVVAPMRVMIPFSTQGRNASCLMISRTRPTPSVAAENGSKCRSV